MRPIALLLAGLTVASARLVAQSCTEPHYRWSEKTTLELAAVVATKTSIHSMLTTWPQPAIYGAADKCAARTGRELKVYSVTAWVRRRRIESPPDGDGDWHLELTTADTDTVPDNCIVVEIPSPEYGAQYDVARVALTTLIADAGATINAAGDLSTPVRLKFIGPAFFDGEHRGKKGTTNPPHQHGRCNSSTRALWELHPVYAVIKPGGG